MSDDMPDYLKEKLFEYKQVAKTNEYKDNWEKIFGKKSKVKEEKIPDQE